MSLIIKLLLALLALALGVVAVALAGNRLPWSEPPGVWQRLVTYLTTNVAETAPDHSFPELRERRYARPANVVWIATEQALTSMGWEVVARDETEHRLHAVVTTALWRFKDDVRIALREEGERTAVTLRAASRVGRADLGANTRHVLDFYTALEDALGVGAATQ